MSSTAALLARDSFVELDARSRAARCSTPAGFANCSIPSNA